MKRALIFCSIFLASSVSVNSAETAKEIITATWSKVDLQLALNNRLAEMPSPYLDNSHASGEGGTRSVAKAVVFSAVIPGTGQIYNGSILKSIFFLAVEVGTITGYIINQNRGGDLENLFEAFADQHWVELDYWQSVAFDSGLTQTDIAGLDMFTLRGILSGYERRKFSHFLPERKNQQYYENIGKYDQFNAGWDDGEAIRARDSENREQYTLMRKDTNDHFKRASNFAAAALFNHVLSALDAGWTAKRHNKEILKGSLEMQGRVYGAEVVPTLVLGLTW